MADEAEPGEPGSAGSTTSDYTQYSCRGTRSCGCAPCLYVAVHLHILRRVTLADDPHDARAPSPVAVFGFTPVTTVPRPGTERARTRSRWLLLGLLCLEAAPELLRLVLRPRTLGKECEGVRIALLATPLLLRCLSEAATTAVVPGLHRPAPLAAPASRIPHCVRCGRTPRISSLDFGLAVARLAKRVRQRLDGGTVGREAVHLEDFVLRRLVAPQPEPLADTPKVGRRHLNLLSAAHTLARSRSRRRVVRRVRHHAAAARSGRADRRHGGRAGSCSRTTGSCGGRGPRAIGACTIRGGGRRGHLGIR
eukprot:511076-Prymnesium_polylepis.1